MTTNSRTKIVATIGPASSPKEVLREMILAGTDVFRINFSHGSHEDHGAVINTIRELNDELGTYVPILADLQGPKLRIGVMEGGSVMLEAGKEIVFSTVDGPGTAGRVFMTYNNFPRDTKPGEKILLDDGKLLMEVVSTNGVDEVVAKILHGGPLSSKKGVNLPNTKISLPCLTPKDLKDLDFALENDIEWIGLSFVRNAADIIELQHIIAAKGKASRVVAKIEKPEAIEDIDNIIKEADALMVARGDLGVEVPMQSVPLIQKMLVRKCLNASTPVIIATQMMESMITNISPTRAEVNDAANSILDGADAVMLSGETSVGAHPAMVIQAMQKIIANVEDEQYPYNRQNQDPFPSVTDRYVSDSICTTAAKMAKDVSAKAVITMTYSGYTAFRLASYRPKALIFAFTSNKAILNTLSLLWGVRAFYYDKEVSTDHTIADIKHRLKKEGFIDANDLIINIASIPMHEHGKANMIKLSLVD